MGSSLTRNEILLGARLGPYEVLRFMGTGGTGSVFQGRHVALGKPVAIKILHDHLAGDPNVAGRFLREGRIAAQLRHPHSLDVLDVGEERGVAYLVMELLDGGNLGARLRDNRCLPLEEALELVFPVAAALAYAHAHGIIHRDIKPGNIFLARDARGTVVPKLVDFGLSKVLDSVEGEPLTTTDVMMGTVQYMAPEQTKGGRLATAKSDQYSLAAVFYECIAGRSPFSASGFYELLEAVRTSVLEPPSASNARVPPALDLVVVRALERDPAKRFPSVRAFAAELLPFATAPLAEAWRRDFVDSTSGSRGRPTRSSASMKAVEAITQDEPATPPPVTPPVEVRNPALGLSPPRDVRIANKPIAKPPAKPVDWFVPFPKPREQIGDAKHFRSTWLTASQATLRERGLWARYEASIDPKHRAAVLSAVAGVWLPMEVARAHYAAADGLGLTDAELVEIGAAAMRRANATALSFVTRMAQGAGVTPWTALAQTKRFWAQTCDDGFIGVMRMGPKEANVEVLGYPLASLRYNRVTMRGILVGCVELFCRKAYVKEIPSLCTPRSVGLTLSWV